MLYAVFEGNPGGRAVLGTFGILVLALVVWVIRSSPRFRWITLIAWGFAYAYLDCQVWLPGSFAGATSSGKPEHFLELLDLSFNNLSSAGLGDIVPVKASARVLVMLEQVAGVGYVTIVVSRLIGMTILRKAQEVELARSFDHPVAPLRLCVFTWRLCEKQFPAKVPSEGAEAQRWKGGVNELTVARLRNRVVPFSDSWWGSGTRAWAKMLLDNGVCAVTGRGTRVALQRRQQPMDILKPKSVKRARKVRPAVFIAGSPALRPVRQLIERVWPSDANVLITGENGSGKGVVARALRAGSARSGKPMVTVNIGGLSEVVFESELFGHVKGAFTDAKVDRIGRFELADNGTVFLDEIANMPLNQQAQLLRVIETGEFGRVGASRTRRVDVRILSATNADLQVDVTAGRFRKNLLFRLNTIEIRLQPLRDRFDDIPVLAEQFLKQHIAR